MFKWFKKKKNFTHKITCGNCTFIRLCTESPSGGLYTPLNSASYCPKCNYKGGGFDYYHGEEIIQYDEKDTKKIIKSNKAIQKEMAEYYLKNTNIGLIPLNNNWKRR